MKLWLFAIMGSLTILCCGCTTKVKVEPIKVEPIYMTLDIHIKVDRQLEDFFSFEKDVEKKVETKTETKAPVNP
jgi:hypothetical protein